VRVVHFDHARADEEQPGFGRGEAGFVKLVEGAFEPDRPGAAEDAAAIFYDADRRTYGGRFEFVVHRQEVPEPLEYRIVIDNRDYQRTLSRLQFLAMTAGRHGWAIHLRL